MTLYVYQMFFRLLETLWKKQLSLTYDIEDVDLNSVKHILEGEYRKSNKWIEL